MTAGRRPSPLTPTAPGGGFLYYWLLLAIFVEYARPASYIPGFNLTIIYSLIPMALFVVTLFAPGLRPTREIFADPITKWIFVFLALVLLSIAVAPLKQFALDTFTTVLGYVFLFWLIARVATTLDRLRGIFLALLLAHVFLLAMNPEVVLDPATRHYVIGATFLGDGNDFALSLCILFPLVIELAQSRRSLAMRILAWACAVLLVMAIIGTQSRGGTLGIAAVLGYRWLRSSHKLLGLAGIAVIGATMLLFAPPAYFDRMGTITSHTDGSAQGRIQAWSGGIGMAVNNPVFGVGAGQFGPRWGKTAHSSYVLLFAELGFPGLVVIIMLVFGNLRANMKVRRLFQAQGPPSQSASESEHVRMQFATSAAMIGFAVAGAFLSAPYYPHLFVLTGIMLSSRALLPLHASTGDVPTPPSQVTANGRPRAVRFRNGLSSRK